MTSAENDITVKAIAQKVLDKTKYNIQTSNNQDNFGFLLTVLTIVSIILTLVQIIQECNDNKTKQFSSQEKYDYFGQEIKTISIKKSWFTKMMIKKTIRKELTREEYKNYGLELTNAILDTGENLTRDEIVSLVEVSNV